jgi:hypothetical protein
MSLLFIIYVSIVLVIPALVILLDDMNFERKTK